ncbi:MAG: haloacid dehalogenase-like hydrolase [Clostridiales bacterium]|nr:haloacid dehalogenase-like hydrolase [Clostridiales bacterium]
MENTPIFAIMYDFDRTLSPRDMQEYQFIPSIGMTAADFWGEANSFGDRNKMDKILSYMYTMIKKSNECGVPLTRERVVNCGKNIEFFKGVTGWFERMNKFGIDNGINVEHYVLSSGLVEIIEGSVIGKYFKKIYASEFLYDENGVAVFPKSAVNYTSKTQFVYRINKGVLDVSNDRDLNSSMPDSDRRVRFQNMLYIGDGLSDVPCMKMVKAYGGSSIAVYNVNSDRRVVEDLLNHGRVDYMFPADYSENTDFDITVKNIIKKAAIEDSLIAEHNNQLKDAGDKQYSIFY